MEPTPKQICQWLEWSERAQDGTLAATEAEQFRQDLERYPQAIQWCGAAFQQRAELLLSQQAVTNPLLAPQVDQLRLAWLQPLTWIGLIVLGLGVGIWGLTLNQRTQLQIKPEVATLVRVSHASWASSTLPTAEGSRITQGSLELLSGMAVLKFDSGAEVVMEAPATLEIIDAMHCRLERGTLVADVPPQATGFTVDTPEAKIVDYGTKFGVSAGENGKYLVKVLSGEVTVEDKQDQAGPKTLLGGQSVDKGLRMSQIRPLGAEQEPARWQPNEVRQEADGWKVISTAYGRGRDTYVQSNDNKKSFGADPYMRVKHSGIVQNLDRKAYLSFDVSNFNVRDIEGAELVLSVDPSDLGFASLVPDSQFTVYGLTDQSLDDWQEADLNWQNAPAQNVTQGVLNQPDLSRARKLGSFTVAQGMLGRQSLQSEALRHFLAEDSNGQVTFIICRDTPELDKDGLVHAFATKESRTNQPPLLRVRLRN